MTTHEEWLASVREEPIEPDLPIIDPHHHLWDRPAGRYFLEEFLADTSGLNIRQTVFVECSTMYRATGPAEFRAVGETAWAQGQAAQSASGAYGETRVAAGIVGTANLTLGEGVAPVLEAHLAAGLEHFRGIRHRAAWAGPDVLAHQPASQPAHLLLDESFRRGFALLRPYGLSFDAWLFHPQLPELADLARSFPDTTIIVNHLGAPLGVGPYAGKRAEVFAQWKGDLATVAAFPNVVIKLGGLGMALTGYGWHERERPPASDDLLQESAFWYECAIELFGPDRCMFESNFPPDRAACSYVVLWNMFKKLTRRFSPAARAALFHDTARRVYRLPGPPVSQA